MALRIPLSWLQDYVDLEQDPVKLAEALTISGMEVESIEHLGDNWGEFCRVGEVKKVCLLYTSPSPRDRLLSRMPSSA